MKTLLSIMLLLCASVLNAKEYQLQSPDGNLVVSIRTGDQLLWRINKKGKTITDFSEASLRLSDGTVYGSGTQFRRPRFRTVDETLVTPIYKRAEVRNVYNEMVLPADGFEVVFRAYDDGVAYRFITKSPVTVVSETAGFVFPEDCRLWASYVKEEGTFDSFSALLRIYMQISVYLNGMPTDWLCCL